MRTLVIDIETRPNEAYVWGLWQQDVSLGQLIEPVSMLCFAAKWLDSRKIFFASVHADGKEAMLELAHSLLDEADVVMSYNGRSFDVRHLNREFIQAGMRPPSPFQQIDLFQTVKRKFNFPSSKLDYVTRALGLGGKFEHEGFSMWVACMAGDESAWRKMRKYNIADVRLTQELYEILQPWIPGHPNRTLYDGAGLCPQCGAEGPLQRRGFAFTKGSKFQRWQCQACGAWFRSTKRELGSELTEVVG